MASRARRCPEESRGDRKLQFAMVAYQAGACSAPLLIGLPPACIRHRRRQAPPPLVAPAGAKSLCRETPQSPGKTPQSPPRAVTAPQRAGSHEASEQGGVPKSPEAIGKPLVAPAGAKPSVAGENPSVTASGDSSPASRGAFKQVRQRVCPEGVQRIRSARKTVRWTVFSGECRKARSETSFRNGRTPG